MTEFTACEECRYFVLYFPDSQKITSIGHCRRFPPTKHVSGAYGHPGTPWPLVDMREWCGEFVRNPKFDLLDPITGQELPK